MYSAGISSKIGVGGLFDMSHALQFWLSHHIGKSIVVQRDVTKWIRNATELLLV
jgi:hypothetical protein